MGIILLRRGCWHRHSRAIDCHWHYFKLIDKVGSISYFEFCKISAANCLPDHIGPASAAVEFTRWLLLLWQVEMETTQRMFCGNGSGLVLLFVVSYSD